MANSIYEKQLKLLETQSDKLDRGFTSLEVKVTAQSEKLDGRLAGLEAKVTALETAKAYVVVLGLALGVSSGFVIDAYHRVAALEGRLDQAQARVDKLERLDPDKVGQQQQAAVDAIKKAKEAQIDEVNSEVKPLVSKEMKQEFAAYEVRLNSVDQNVQSIFKAAEGKPLHPNAGALSPLSPPDKQNLASLEAWMYEIQKARAH